MKDLTKYAIISSLAILFILSCTKPPDYPPEPVIEFMSLSKNTVIQNSPDSLLMTISFTDGDGNLGNEDNQANISFTDLRDNSSFITFSSPLVPIQGANNGISGEISMILEMSSPICCIYSNGLPSCQPSADFPVDTLIYEIKIMDRDSNWSNTIQTDPIFLLCQ